MPLRPELFYFFQIIRYCSAACCSSWERQTTLFEKQVEKQQAAGLSYEDAYEKAKTVCCKSSPLFGLSSTETGLSAGCSASCPVIFPIKTIHTIPIKRIAKTASIPYIFIMAPWKLSRNLLFCSAVIAMAAAKIYFLPA